MPLINKEKSLCDLQEEISELKKKIQLSEGQRKAHFEENDSKKKKNAELIRNLKKEIKTLYQDLKRRPKLDEKIIQLCEKSPKEISEYLNKSPDQVLRILDLKNIDLKKKLDRAKFRLQQEHIKYNTLLETLENLKIQYHPAIIKKETEPILKMITGLENKEYRIKLKWHEMLMMNKKFLSIRQNLREDSVYFDNTLDDLRQQLRRQQQEMKHLQEVMKEAEILRDTTRESLDKLESAVIVATAQRESHIADLRKTVEERKLQLEKVEKDLLPSALTEQESNEDKDNEEIQVEKDLLEATFIRLKDITGSKTPVEVVKRFKEQEETKKCLENLKEQAEKTKKELEVTRSTLESQLEAYKFSKQTESNAEGEEKLEEDILMKLEEKEKLENDNTEKREILKYIERFFSEMLIKITIHLGEVQENDGTIQNDLQMLIGNFKEKLLNLVKLNELKLQSSQDEDNLDPNDILAID